MQAPCIDQCFLCRRLFCLGGIKTCLCNVHLLLRCSFRIFIFTLSGSQYSISTFQRFVCLGKPVLAPDKALLAELRALVAFVSGALVASSALFALASVDAALSA